MAEEPVVLGLLGLPWLCAVVWISLAVQAKRWHDRGKSAAMILINFIPVIGWIWALIELGFARGSVDKNLYGEDPVRDTSGAYLLRYWFPALLWALLIFSASSDTKSSHKSSRLIGPFVKLFVPDISEARLEQIVFGVRKGAHLTEYAVLSWLLARAFLRPGTPWGRWNRKAALLAWLIASLYAASDELHQAYVPNRTGRWTDVGLDSFGATVGIVTLYYFGRWRKYW